MENLDKNYQIILKHEELFVNKIALHVIEKPKLIFWMILIPVIFVYYFFELQKFSRGKKGFVENYMISLKRALDEAKTSITNGTDVDTGKFRDVKDLTQNGQQEYKNLLKTLSDYYFILLKGEGDDFPSLVRSCFQGKKRYLGLLTQLNSSWKKLNRALVRDSAGMNGHDSLINKIEIFSKQYRNTEADEIFDSV